MKKTVWLATAALFTLAFAESAATQKMVHELQQKLATVKESVARNQAELHQYTWHERTEISLKGEVKKTKKVICHYGHDGIVQKTPLGPPAPQKELRGVKKRVVGKVDELQDYMERALALIADYMPPAPQKMEAAFQAGNASLGQADPGRIALQFKDYVKPGDSLAFSFDMATRALGTIRVDSYLDDQKDAVTLEVGFLTLPDKTNCPASTLLVAATKQIQVRITNSDYQKVAQ